MQFQRLVILSTKIPALIKFIIEQETVPGKIIEFHTILQSFPFKMNFGWAFYNIPIENYALSNISNFIFRNISNHLIRHWAGDSPRKNYWILRYSTMLPL